MKNPTQFIVKTEAVLTYNEPDSDLFDRAGLTRMWVPHRLRWVLLFVGAHGGAPAQPCRNHEGFDLLWCCRRIGYSPEPAPE
jgi:hypothetical protein